MSKRNSWLLVIMILALALSACATGNNAGGNVAGGTPGADVGATNVFEEPVATNEAMVATEPALVEGTELPPTEVVDPTMFTQTPVPVTGGEAGEPSQPGRYAAWTNLLDYTVITEDSVNAADDQVQRLGALEDLLLSVNRGGAGGQGAYLVVNVDESFLGLAPDEYVLVPLRSVQIYPEQGALVIPGVTVDKFGEAPRFSSWPDFNAADWDKDVVSYWGMGGGARQGQTFVRLSDLVGFDVRGAEAPAPTSEAPATATVAATATTAPTVDPNVTQAPTEVPMEDFEGTFDLGDVQDFVFDAQGGSSRLGYLMVVVDDELAGDTTERLVAVPLTQVSIFPREGVVQLKNMTGERFSQLPRLGELPDLSDPNWDQDFRGQWGG